MPPEPTPQTGVARPDGPDEVLTPEQVAAREKAEAERELTGDMLVTLSQLRKGQTALELAQALAELNVAVREHGKSGTVTIKFEVKPMKGADAITVTDTITKKIPQGQRPVSVMWTDDKGRMLSDPPDQFAAFSRQELRAGGAR